MKQGKVVFIGNPFRREVGRANNRKDHIIDTVSRYYGVDLRRPTRKRSVLFPRQVCMGMLNEFYNMGVTDIGREFGRSHATVICAIKRINGLCETNDETKRQIEEIKSML